MYISLHAQAGSLVKLGAWGGDHGGKEYDVTVAPQRLEGFWLRYGKVIDCISFSYLDKDKNLHTIGPWGGQGGLSEETVRNYTLGSKKNQYGT